MKACRTISKRLLHSICFIFVLNTLLFGFLSNFSVRAQEVSADETVEFKSGNGTVGSRDSLVTFAPFYGNAHQQDGLTASDFQKASSGEHAYIIDPHDAWIDNLSLTNNSKWISAKASSRVEGIPALYAIPFTVKTSKVNSLLFEVNFAADNNVFFEGKTGVFVNGTQLICPDPPMIGNFGSNTIANCTYAGENVHTGVNTFYLLVGNDYGPSGLIFEVKLFVNPKNYFVLGASTEYNPSPTPTLSPTTTPTPTQTVTPTPVQLLAQNTGSDNKGGLPEAGVSLNLSMAFLAIGVWSYYFYLKFRLV